MDASHAPWQYECEVLVRSRRPHYNQNRDEHFSPLLAEHVQPLLAEEHHDQDSYHDKKASCRRTAHQPREIIAFNGAERPAA
eukprot:301757-Heterocapsa_arctica.AAC.1